MENLRTLNTTLLLIERDNKILLGKKKRGFVKGTFIGIGGKQELGETIDQTMIRETFEEIGVKPTKYEKVGLIDYDTYYKGEHVNMILNVYICTEYEGQVKETDEIEPYWFLKTEIPYDKMLASDVIWTPMVLEGKIVKGKVAYNQNMEIVSQNLVEVKSL